MKLFQISVEEGLLRKAGFLIYQLGLSFDEKSDRRRLFLVMTLPFYGLGKLAVDLNLYPSHLENLKQAT